MSGKEEVGFPVSTPIITFCSFEVEKDCSRRSFGAAIGSICWLA